MGNTRPRVFNLLKEILANRLLASLRWTILSVPKTKEISLKYGGYIMLWVCFAASGGVSLVCVDIIIKGKKKK